MLVTRFCGVCELLVPVFVGLLKHAGIMAFKPLSSLEKEGEREGDECVWRLCLRT